MSNRNIKISLRRTTSRGGESESSQEPAPEGTRGREVQEVVSSAENSVGAGSRASATSGDEEEEDEGEFTGEERVEEEQETDPSSHPPPAPEAPRHKPPASPPPRKERRSAPHEPPPRRQHDNHSRGASRRAQPPSEETSSVDYEYSDQYSNGHPHGWTWVPDSDHGQHQQYQPHPHMQHAPHGYQQQQYYDNRPPPPPAQPQHSYSYHQQQPPAPPPPQPQPAPPPPQQSTQLVHVPSHDPYYPNPFTSAYSPYMHNPFAHGYPPHPQSYFPQTAPQPYTFVYPPAPQQSQPHSPSPPAPPQPDPEVRRGMEQISEMLRDQKLAADMAAEDKARHDAAHANDVLRQTQTQVDALQKELDKYEAEKQKAELEREKKVAVDAATEKAKLEAENAAKEKEHKKTQEHQKALDKAKEAEKKAEEAKKKAEEELEKVKPGDDDLQKPIKFEDAVGRKFSFPWKHCKTWRGMNNLIQQAFQQIENYTEEVQSHHFDLLGPDGEIILPAIWEYVVQPDWTIKMHMWPMTKDIIEGPGDITEVPPPPKQHHRRNSQRKGGGSGGLFPFGLGRNKKPRHRPTAVVDEVLDDGIVASSSGPEITTVPIDGGRAKSNTRAKRQSAGPSYFTQWAGGGAQVRRRG